MLLSGWAKNYAELGLAYGLSHSYGFEVLRAGTLFTEGAFKHKKSGPKFEKRGSQKLKRENLKELLPNMEIGYPIIQTGDCYVCNLRVWQYID